MYGSGPDLTQENTALAFVLNRRLSQPNLICLYYWFHQVNNDRHGGLNFIKNFVPYCTSKYRESNHKLNEEKCLRVVEVNYGVHSKRKFLVSIGCEK